MSVDDNYFSIREISEAVGLDLNNETAESIDLDAESDSGSSERLIDDLEDRDYTETEEQMDVSLSNDPLEERTNPEIPDETFYGIMVAKRKRNKNAKPETWSRNVKKNLRMHGQGYSGWLKTKSMQNKTEVQKNEKLLGPSCKSRACEKTKLRSCSTFTESARKKIFEHYWSLDWKQKRVYVNSLVDKGPIKKYGLQTGRRTISYAYSLKDDEKKSVCQKMFCSTLGMQADTIHNWLKEKDINFEHNSSFSQKDSKKEEYLNAFFRSIPKLPSHYTRANSTKIFLEPNWSTKMELYRCYAIFCKSKISKPFCRSRFFQVYEKSNFSIFHPKKDQCDLCCAHKVGNISQVLYDEHILRKSDARKEKEEDKKKAVEKLWHVVTMDLESVKLAPFLKASSMYYKSKLIVHNFTVYDLVTKQVKCYWFDETEGDLCASTFATCLCDFLERYLDDLPIIIYSDGCTNQNRNAIMSNALLHYAMEKGKTIYQKFLEKGHTQMEVDSVHSAIECKLKDKEIYLPTEYLEISQNASVNPFPYESTYLSHTFFKNYSESSVMRYASIRPGKNVGDPCVVDIRGLKYVPIGKMYFFLNYSDNWRELPQKQTERNITFSQFPNMFSQRIKITSKKWKDLQELKPVIPLDFHSYYDSIPYNAA